jgi:hypothetical protein
MIGLIFCLAWQQGDIAKEMEAALKGKKLTGTEFHRALTTSFTKAHLETYRVEHTVGDKRGIIVIGNTATKDPNSFPIWWQYFIWPDGTQNHVQLLKKAEFFDEGGTFTEGQTYWRGDRLVIAGSEVNGGNGERAALTSFALKNGTWRKVQHLESRREGGAFFATLQNSYDPSIVRVITRDYPQYLNQPHVGPLLRYEERWRLKGGAYSKGQPALVYTPLVEMVKLAGFVTQGNRRAFDKAVPLAFRTKLWEAVHQNRMALSPSSMVSDSTDQFQFGDNGPIVQFRKTGGKWVLWKWKD